MPSNLIRSLVFFLLLLSFEGFAQKIIYPHTVFWHKTEINQINYDSKWGYGVDFVYRRKNELNQGSMFQSPLRESIRPWVHYQFNPYSRLSISPIGYMNTNEYIGKPEDYERKDYHEWRTTIQYFHHQKVLGGRIWHTWRYRYELRWQYQPNTADHRYFTRFRFRYRIRYIFNSNDFYENNIIYAAVSNELGINLGQNVVMNTFNQNRLYVGIGYRFLTSIRAELRYVNRFRTRGATGFEFDQGSGVMLGVYVDQLSLVGKKPVRGIRFSD